MVFFDRRDFEKRGLLPEVFDGWVLGMMQDFIWQSISAILA
jgi:hypothetical protein